MSEQFRPQPDQSQPRRDAGDSLRGLPERQPDQTSQGGEGKSPELDLPRQAKERTLAQGDVQQKNSDKRKEYRRRYYQKYKERLKEKSRQYYQENKDKRKVSKRQYYQENKDKRKVS